MDQLIYASLSHTHYWYEVGMLKVFYSHLIIEKIKIIVVTTYLVRRRGSTHTRCEYYIITTSS